jgi:hypothetical protein
LLQKLSALFRPPRESLLAVVAAVPLERKKIDGDASSEKREPKAFVLLSFDLGLSIQFD